MSEKDERIACVEEAITSHNERLDSLEKKLDHQNKRWNGWTIKAEEQIAELREEQKAFIEVCQEPCKDCKLNELKEALNEVAQSRIGWEENLENNYRELLKKYSECEDSTIHKNFFLKLLEKLDAPKQTEKKEVGERECPKCGELYRYHNLTFQGNFLCKVNDSGGEKTDMGNSFEESEPVKSLRESDSKLPELICPFCGRKLIRYKQAWICGHGCTKPAIEPKEKTEPEEDIRAIIIRGNLYWMPKGEANKLIEEFQEFEQSLINKLNKDKMSSIITKSFVIKSMIEHLVNDKKKWQGRLKRK